VVRSAVHRENNFFHLFPNKIRETQAPLDSSCSPKSDRHEDISVTPDPGTGELFPVDRDELNLTPDKSDFTEIKSLNRLEKRLNGR